MCIRDRLQTWGLSARMNVFGLLILRLDYSRPIGRPAVNHLWTLSLGPTF